MTKELKRVRIRGGLDLAGLAAEVRDDKEPRVLEEDGKAIAALVSLEDLDRLLLASPPPGGIERALSVAGAWRDLADDEFAERIYRARHEAPPSAPIAF